MFQLWLFFTNIIKKITFKNKEESNIFSSKFNFRKWVTFILIIILVFMTIFMTYKIFAISAKYINLETVYNKETLKYKKEKDLISRIKSLEKTDIELDSANKKMLKLLINSADSSDINNGKKIRFILTDMNQLMTQNSKLILLSSKLILLSNKEIKELIEEKEKCSKQ